MKGLCSSRLPVLFSFLHNGVPLYIFTRYAQVPVPTTRFVPQDALMSVIPHMAQMCDLVPTSVCSSGTGMFCSSGMHMFRVIPHMVPCEE